MLDSTGSDDPESDPIVGTGLVTPPPGGMDVTLGLNGWDATGLGSFSNCVSTTNAAAATARVNSP